LSDCSSAGVSFYSDPARGLGDATLIDLFSSLFFPNENVDESFRIRPLNPPFFFAAGSGNGLCCTGCADVEAAVTTFFSTDLAGGFDGC
jgi:hypothetical protein